MGVGVQPAELHCIVGLFDAELVGALILDDSVFFFVLHADVDIPAAQPAQLDGLLQEPSFSFTKNYAFFSSIFNQLGCVDLLSSH